MKSLREALRYCAHSFSKTLSAAIAVLLALCGFVPVTSLPSTTWKSSQTPVGRVSVRIEVSNIRFLPQDPIKDLKVACLTSRKLLAYIYPPASPPTHRSEAHSTTTQGSQLFPVQEGFGSIISSLGSAWSKPEYMR